MKSRFFFKPYELFLLIAIISLNIIASIINKEFQLLPTVAAISGVLCVVLVAKGHIANYLFGLIQVSLYAWISWGVGYWGEVALNALYYVPMQFVGFFMWRQRMKSGSKTEVQARNMTDKQRIIWGLISAVAVVICGFFLKHYDDPAPFLDSTTTVLSIVAMFLMVRRFSEQWWLWIVVNICTIIMWTSAYLRNPIEDKHALIITTMWIIYLLNSINGLIQWRKTAKVLSATKDPL